MKSLFQRFLFKIEEVEDLSTKLVGNKNYKHTQELIKKGQLEINCDYALRTKLETFNNTNQWFWYPTLITTN